MIKSAISKDDFVSELVERVEKEQAPIPREVAEHFGQRFFQFVPYAEPAEERRNSLIDSAVLMLGHLDGYCPPESKVAVFDIGSSEKRTMIAVLLPDLPFIVDSIRMELRRQGAPIRSILSVPLEVDRDGEGKLLDVTGEGASNTSHREAVICVETDWLDSSDDRQRIQSGVQESLQHVRHAVEDFSAMKERALVEAEYLSGHHALLEGEDWEEAREFLKWLGDSNFVFLGFDEHRFVKKDGTRILEPVEGSVLGTMKFHAQRKSWVIDSLPSEARGFVEAKTILTFVNSTHRSRVHRAVYPDYITVKRFGEDGEIVSVCRFLGLFTSSVYHQEPSEIPLVRSKVAMVKAKSEFSEGSHYDKALNGVLNIYPRDELFQASVDSIFMTSMAIVQLQEAPRVRVFLRRNPYGRFYYCQVFVPKEIYDTELRYKIQRLLCDRLNADDVGFSTTMGETDLARVRFVLHVPSSVDEGVDIKQLEQDVVEVSRSWDETFAAEVCDRGRDDLAELIPIYRGAFPASYREDNAPAAAITDLDSIGEMDAGANLALRFGVHRTNHVRMALRLFHVDEPVPLSDVLPILENMGLRVDNEHPYLVQRRDGVSIWIHEFELIPLFPVRVKEEAVAKRFREAFVRIWSERVVNDEFNALVLGAELSWREVVVFRAYAKYNHQVKFGFGTTYTAETLARHVHIVSLLAAYFRTRFGLEIKNRQGELARLEWEILSALDQVPSLNEDRVLRRFLELMNATLRTNYCQGADQDAKSYLSFKFDPAKITAMPLPRPAYEIFVYSPRMEGVHLRGGKIARGGLRWSDRPEDFRVEVLGLVKAQQVKNAVIVPVGAKGGFVAHQLPVGDREGMLREGRACYRTLLRGMLDVTDNIVEGRVVPPREVVRYDPDDPYLVVAADKGTATFSDIGNSISEEYGFWMGDAFASGGSEGYDHKKMGITAKGAWVSVQRHFVEKGVDVQSDAISVVGIGDMAGDVFGNGMLCSEHICLVAAFNHLHIFIDPNPDPKVGFGERKRLYEEVAGWGRYDTSLISEGGGIFSRDQKEIPLSPQIRERFEIEAESLTPGELITVLLKANVDLLWNGGIGTFVKAESESHEEVGDKTNDGLRVDAGELRCRVVGEGGNLGMTQLARIEFCLNGGACNTDFIDNSAGVDCSDHEVNIKILLNALEREGKLQRKERNELLVGMTDAVSSLVLYNNYRQARAISLAQSQSLKRTVEYLRMLDCWERDDMIDRTLEFLPSNEALQERSARGAGLTRAELSVLIAYSKGILKEALVGSDIISDPLLSGLLAKAFPDEFVDRYRDELSGHALRREIVATQWANDLVNHMGPSYLYRLDEASGASVEEVVRAYAAAREIFSLAELWEEIEVLDYDVSPDVQHGMMYDLSRLVRRGSRWLLRNCREELSDLPKLVARFKSGVQEVSYLLHDLLQEAALGHWEKRQCFLVSENVPEDLAGRIASSSGLYSSFGVIYASEQTGESIATAAKIYFSASDHLELHWLSYRIRGLVVEDHWQARARDSFRDELHMLQRKLTVQILRMDRAGGVENHIDYWMAQRSRQVKRWQVVLEELRAAGTQDYSMYPVVLWELGVLVDKG
ncbi:MAG: NAD-glutamate dehydrogenase [Verrucomicrobiota bacterium]|nr:NAD-glutamate dehydrogenase [Verrucomicrobiota bacterium]